MKTMWQQTTASATLALALLGTPTWAQSDKIILKYASFIPVDHVHTRNHTQPFMDEVRRLSNGRVDFEFYPAEQAGRARTFISLLNTGAMDIAEVSPGYYSATLLPMTAIIEFPGRTRAACEASAALRAIGMPGGPMHEGDFKENGIRGLTFMVNAPFQIAPSRVPIHSMQTLRGKKLRTAGGVMELAARALGATPVSITASEIYTALDRGTLDAVVFTWLLADTYKFPEIAKYGTNGFGFGTPGQFIMVGEKTWQSLPADIQDILVQAGIHAERHSCTFQDNNEAAMVQRYKDSGQNIYEWTEEEKALMLQAVKDLPEMWVDTLEKRGKPARLAWEQFNQALEQYRADHSATQQ